MDRQRTIKYLRVGYAVSTFLTMTSAWMYFEVYKNPKKYWFYGMCIGMVGSFITENRMKYYKSIRYE